MRKTAAILLGTALGLCAQTAIWTPDQAMKIKSVGSVVPSPDSRLVAYAQTEAVMEAERSEMVSQIWLAKADGSWRTQLTRGEKGSASPSFSPDSRYVYFLSSRSGKQNVWRIPTLAGEAEMLTDWKGSLGAYKVSPDGKWIAFTAREEDKDEEKRKKEKRDVKVIDESPENLAIWTIPAEPNEEGKRPPKQILKETYHVASLEWTPDSKSIVYAHWPRPEADHWTKSDISRVTLEDGKVETLAGSNAAESNPRVSPDGRFVAFIRSTDPPRWASQDRIVLIELRPGATARELPATQDEEPSLLGWTSDSRQILFYESRRTRSGLYAMPLDGPPKTVYEPDSGAVMAGALNSTWTMIGFSLETPVEPREGWVAGVTAERRVRVSRANDALPMPPPPKTEIVRWKAKDGIEIEGLLTYPVNYEKGKRYPFILNIHGGPAGVFSERFIGGPGIYPLATFAAKGYAILRANIRGSGGYGAPFRFANLNDWGGKDYADLMAGVAHVIAMGLADPERMAVMGWSYGGFMTSWVITQTNRFKAAVVGAGVTNLWSFTGTADIPGFLPDYFGGEPWKVFENYRAHSPVSFVANVKTPTLILHGQEDIRVPLSQGAEYHNALKRLGVTTKMVVYPRMPHGPTEPKFMLDIMNRHLDWVEKYVP